MVKLAYDFHIHSCLSPCGDNDMTPNNIAGMAFLNGLQAIALADHNTCRNCVALKEAAKQYGLIVLYGMELTTMEEVHVLCLFPDEESAMKWDSFVYSHLLKIKNNPDIFGEQLILDGSDIQIGSEENLLINATDISFDDVFEPVQALGGIAIPAHIDKSANSLLGNLGFVPPNSTFTLAELKNPAKAEQVILDHPYFKNCSFISNSDAHYLTDINTATNFLEVEELTAHSVIEALKNM